MGRVCSIPSKGYTQKLNTTHWPDSSHRIISSCKGGWEVWSLAGMHAVKTSIAKAYRETDIKPKTTQL